MHPSILSIPHLEICVLKENHNPIKLTLASTTKSQWITYHGRLNEIRLQGKRVSWTQQVSDVSKGHLPLRRLDRGRYHHIPLIVEGHPKEKIRTIPIDIPTKTSQPGIGKVASHPPPDLQTHPNTVSTTSQKTGKPDLRIGYHRLDISRLPRYNLPSLLHRLDPIPYPPVQAITGHSQTRHPFQRTPSKITPWRQNTNQSRRDIITGSQNHRNFTHSRHTHIRHHTTSLEPPDKHKQRHSEEHI